MKYVVGLVCARPRRLDRQAVCTTNCDTDASCIVFVVQKAPRARDDGRRLALGLRRGGDGDGGGRG
jgi:hypothetical protein